MLGPILSRPDGLTDAAPWLAASALVAVLSSLHLARLSVALDPPEMTPALSILTLGVAFALLQLGHSAVLFLLALVLSASLAGAGGSAWPTALAVLSALILEGVVYASLPASTAVGLAASPAVLWLLRLRPLARLSPRARALLAATLMALSASVVLLSSR
jgi:hypothetical protein